MFICQYCKWNNKLLFCYNCNEINSFVCQNEEERQQQLRDRAKKLIAEARKNINVSTSSTSINNGGNAKTSISPVSDRSQTSVFYLDKVSFNFF